MKMTLCHIYVIKGLIMFSMSVVDLQVLYCKCISKMVIIINYIVSLWTYRLKTPSWT